ELHNLPDRYRAPLVLCYLEGNTRDEAAAKLGWPAGKFRGMLERAREHLRARLARRGLTLSVTLLGALCPLASAAAVPPGRARAGVEAAAAVAGGKAVTGPAAVLANGLLRELAWGKLWLTLGLVLALGLAAWGGAALQHRPPRPEAAAPAAPEAQEAAD